MPRFNLGDEVWRVQGVPDLGKSVEVVGPASISAIIQRLGGCTYLLEWKRNAMEEPITVRIRPIEVRDEQDPECLHLTKASAQAAADRRHNEWLKRFKR